MNVMHDLIMSSFLSSQYKQKTSRWQITKPQSRKSLANTEKIGANGAIIHYCAVGLLYNRFKRWSEMGVFDKIFMALASQDGPPEQLQIDATHLKAHRTASSLLKKGMFPALLDAQKAA